MFCNNYLFIFIRWFDYNAGVLLRKEAFAGKIQEKQQTGEKCLQGKRLVITWNPQEIYYN
jgi:hypothetical protein